MVEKKYPGAKDGTEKENPEYTFSLLHYEVDENGNYVSAPTTNWGGKFYTVPNSWDTVFERLEEAEKQIQSGEASPIAYYMVKSMMDVGIVSNFTGLAKWKIKRHLKAKHFAKLSQEILGKYAQAFDIKVDELINFKANHKTENE